MEAESADSPFEKENFIGDELDVLLLKDYLKTAYCIYGHTFNVESHTPRQLYEALSDNKKYEFQADGDFSLNEEDDSLPDGALSHKLQTSAARSTNTLGGKYVNGF